MEALIRRIDWNLEAEANLKAAARGDLDWIRNEVHQGQAALYRCGQDGYIVGRLESDSEAVLILGAGKNSRKWIPIFEQIMLLNGAKTIRTHIERSGLNRIYRGLGWYQDAVIMKKRLAV